MNKRLKAFEKQQHINATYSFTNKQHKSVIWKKIKKDAHFFAISMDPSLILSAHFDHFNH